MNLQVIYISVELSSGGKYELKLKNRLMDLWESLEPGKLSIRVIENNLSQVVEKALEVLTSDDQILSQFNEQIIRIKGQQLESNLAGVEVDIAEKESSFADPYDPELIRVDNRSFTIDYVYRLVESKEIDLSPDFQRHFVWKELWKKSSLIESIMLRIPLPVFYFSQDNDGLFQVIDGLQRLTVIKQFIENSFRLKHLEYLHDCENKTFSDLEPKYRRRIEQTAISINIIDPQTPSSVKFEIFKRINQGGKPLNGQEIRNSMAKPRTREFINRLCISEEFKIATDFSIHGVRMEDQELIMRFVGFHFYNNINRNSFIVRYTGDMNAFLDEVLDRLNREKESIFKSIEVAFLNSMKNCYFLFGKYTFRKCLSEHLYPESKKQLINKSLFIVWSVLLAPINHKDLINRNIMGSMSKVLANRLEEDPEYFSSLSTGTNDIMRLKYAFEIAEKLIAQNLAI